MRRVDRWEERRKTSVENKGSAFFQVNYIMDARGAAKRTSDERRSPMNETPGRTTRVTGVADKFPQFGWLCVNMFYFRFCVAGKCGKQEKRDNSPKAESLVSEQISP